MKTRDFINIGVFIVIHFALAFTSGMLGIINPLMMFVEFALGIIANGVVISLFRSRVRKIGTLAALGLLVGVSMMLAGHLWVVVILTPLLSLIGDFLYSKGEKKLQYSSLRPVLAVVCHPVVSGTDRRGGIPADDY